MKATTAKKMIATEVSHARVWTKTYLQDINDAITAGDWEAAEYIASQLAPIWGEIENTIVDMRNSMELPVRVIADGE
jgi:iron uptake system EfeUOB component EfeO/EfeM